MARTMVFLVTGGESQSVGLQLSSEETSLAVTGVVAVGQQHGKSGISAKERRMG